LFAYYIWTHSHTQDLDRLQENLTSRFVHGLIKILKLKVL